jgi:hypothetical protein
MFLEGAYAANTALLVEDTYSTLEGLKNTLEVQALTDARVGKSKAEDFVELRLSTNFGRAVFWKSSAAGDKTRRWRTATVCARIIFRQVDPPRETKRFRN